MSEVSVSGRTPKRPNPVVWRGSMIVDLRPWGYGQRYVLGPADMSREDALCAAYEKLAELRGERVAESAQRQLFGAPELFGGALDAWQAEKQWKREGSKRWGKTYARLVRRDLAAYKLDDFNQPAGNALLASYVSTLVRRHLSGRTIRNYLNVAEQVLRFALERGWLLSAPLHPRMPPKAAPVLHWLTEDMFRALRAELFRTRHRDGAAADLTDGEMVRAVPSRDPFEVKLYIARRRMYLSWLFYTGVHHKDADDATADWLFLDGKMYIRHNNKSARVFWEGQADGGVSDQQFPMPEPLYLDLVELCELQGRAFYPGEAFTGGPWPEVARAMQGAARRLGFPNGANPMMLRRSFAREMILRGYEVREVANMMGHVDERMVNEIYQRTPRARGSAVSRWSASPPAARPPSPSGMARVYRMGSKHPKGHS